jgi:Flp pilus assembly protein CpaB
MTVAVRPDNAVAGRLKPGDTVQVLVTVGDKNHLEARARSVVDRASVFDVGREPAAGGSFADVDRSGRGAIATLTLAVTPDQARQLAEARHLGDLDVVLLPPAAAQAR